MLDDTAAYESLTSLQIKQLTDERDKLTKELTTTRFNYEESQERVSQLEAIVTEQTADLNRHIEQYCNERDESNLNHQQVCIIRISCLFRCFHVCGITKKFPLPPHVHVVVLGDFFACSHFLSHIYLLNRHMTNCKAVWNPPLLNKESLLVMQQKKTTKITNLCHLFLWKGYSSRS